MSEDMPMPMPMPMDHMAMMHMTFFWGKDVVMLFDDWPNGKLGMYILALVFVFVLAVIVEFLSGPTTIKTGAYTTVSGLAEQALVYGIRTALAYLLMLSVMSYNLGVFIAVVFGHAIGFILVKHRGDLKATNDDAE
ncbi:hypothetical protein LXL04_036228 [Taraxacum kok-saghyz]